MLGRGVVLVRLARSAARFPVMSVEVADELEAEVLASRDTRSWRERGLLTVGAATGEGELTVAELLRGLLADAASASAAAGD